MQADSTRGQGLAVAIAAWPDDAESPVCLMIDDLTDGWIDADGSGLPLGRNDWGHGLDRRGSSFHFLESSLFREFPEVRTTFFVPVDRVEDIRPGRFAAHYERIDRRPEFVRFLRELDASPRFECAYHGKEHGEPGPTNADYRAEFETFESVQAALDALRAGEEIWNGVFGSAPSGGKYPAYAMGEFGDAAVDLAGYAWWCRRWDRGLGDAADPAAFQPRWFGERGVVDVPSSLHGGVLTTPPLSRIPLRGIAWYVRMRIRGRAWLDAQLDALLASRSVVSVQEHITSSRPDGFAQTPNVYDDVATLRHLFSRLRGRRVWHATCGEIASYWRARAETRVRVRSRASFEVSLSPDASGSAALSLVLNGAVLPDALRLRGPSGEVRARVSRRPSPLTAVTSPVLLEPGVYEIVGP